MNNSMRRANRKSLYLQTQARFYVRRTVTKGEKTVPLKPERKQNVGFARKRPRTDAQHCWLLEHI